MTNHKDALTKALELIKEGRRAIGNHYAPNDCYATGPMTGDPFRDLVQCPACSFIAMHDEMLPKLTAALSVIPADATQEREPEYCPNCQGTGETTVMSDNGPDAYEVPVVCPFCEGHQTLEAAFRGACKLLDTEQKKYLKACGEIWRMSGADGVDWKDMFEKRTRERDALRERLDKYEKDDVVYPISIATAQPSDKPEGKAEQAAKPISEMTVDECLQELTDQAQELDMGYGPSDPVNYCIKDRAEQAVRDEALEQAIEELHRIKHDPCIALSEEINAGIKAIRSLQSTEQKG